MNRTLLLIGMLVLGAFSLRGQSYIVRGTIANAEKGQVYLAAFHGDRYSLVDSIQTASGEFHFLFNPDTDPGLYRIIFSGRFIEFIFNWENVEVFVANGEMGPVPYFDNTVENQVYSEFMEYELNYEARVLIAYGLLPDPDDECISFALDSRCQNPCTADGYFEELLF